MEEVDSVSCVVPSEFNDNFICRSRLCAFIFLMPLCTWPSSENTQHAVLIKSRHTVARTQPDTHEPPGLSQLWLRLSVNNANGQQANEHVMADWKGINEHGCAIALARTKRTHNSLSV